MKTYSLILALLIFPLSVAATLPDVEGHTFQMYIDEMQGRGVIQGYSDGSFKPDKLVNRAEFLKMLMRASFGSESTSTNITCFTDFAGEEQWFWKYACSAKERGFVDGHPDGSFRGETPVNLAEALKMSLDAWELPLPQYFAPPEHWYDPYFDAQASQSVFIDIPRVPDLQLTRAEAAFLLSTIDPTPMKTRSQSSVSSDSSDSSASSFIYTPPVYHGALRIEQQALGALNTTVGKKDVLLLHFDAVAGRQDVFITQLKFTSDVGSLLSGTNYKLYHDGKIIGAAVPQNEMLTFININIPVPDGVLERVELRGDVKQSGASSFSVQFATSEPDFVLGVDAIDGREVTGIELNNGACPTVSICWIAVYTDTSRLISLGSTPGSLFVTQDKTPVRNRQLLLGDESGVVLRLNLRATDEDIKVTKLRIGGATDTVDLLQLYTSGAGSPFATARKSACETVTTGQFCADTNFIVQKDQDLDILVRAQLNTDISGGSSGDTAAFALSASTTGGSVAVDAEGDATLTELSQNDGDSSAEGEVFIGRSTAGSNSAIVGPTHDMVAAKIIDIINTHTDPDETAVPVGMSTFASFTFRAADHSNTMNGLNNVEMTEIEFRITSTNVEFASNSIELYNTASPSTTTSCSQSATTGVITVTCSSLDSASVSTIISEGTGIELALRGDITNPQVGAGTSTLQAQIQGLGNRLSSGPIKWDDEVQSLQWVDVDESSVRSTLYRNQ